MALAAMNQILVVAAHPDDEVLGCGGTIARHADSGDQVQVLVVAGGSLPYLQVCDFLCDTDEYSSLTRWCAAQMGIKVVAAFSLFR